MNRFVKRQVSPWRLAADKQLAQNDRLEWMNSSLANRFIVVLVHVTNRQDER